MDSPIVTQLFRQLFRHPACRSRRNLVTLAATIQDARRLRQRRAYSSQRGGKTVQQSESHWQQRTELFPVDMTEEFRKYPMVTAKELRSRRDRPRRVKMLTRDFIEGAYMRM